MRFEEWLSQQDGVIEVDCGCVTTEAFYHWMRVAYEAGTLTNEDTKQEWTGIPDIDNAIIMLDRIETLESCDDDRIEAVKALLRGLAGNSPVIPGAEQRIADAVELLKLAAPAMLADNGGPDGPLVGRLKSPVIPEGYVMVPKEPTAEMIAAAMNCDDVEFNSDETFCVNFDNIYAAMVEAAPQPQNAQQNIPEIIPGWIPVSERMPGSQEWVIVFAKWANQQVLCWDDVQNRWTDFEDQSYYADMFTHWMPLPAAPQEVKP